MKTNECHIKGVCGYFPKLRKEKIYVPWYAVWFLHFSFCGWISDWWHLQDSKRPATTCVPERERAMANLKPLQPYALGPTSEREFIAKTHMGNISLSLTICTVSTKQQSKTSSLAHVFYLSLLTTPRFAPPLTPPKKKPSLCRMCGFWSFDRVKPAELLEGPRRKNPTIQDQACNSRGKDMCCRPAGKKEEARETERRQK